MCELDSIRRHSVVFIALVCALVSAGFVQAPSTQRATPPPQPVPAVTAPVAAPVAQQPPVPGHAPTYEELAKAAEEQITPQIQSVHGIDAWSQKSIMQADIELDKPGKPGINGTITIDTHGDRIRFDSKDGGTLLFDGEKYWSTFKPPADAATILYLKPIRTFLTFPFMLREPTTHLNDYKIVILKGTSNNQFKATFDSASNARPIEWCLVYADHVNKLLRALAYRNVESANNPDDTNPSEAVTYDDYNKIDGVMLAATWTFWNWNADRGVFGEAIGHGKVSNIKYLPADEKTFAKPADAKERMMSTPTGK